MRYSELTWFAPKKAKRRHRRLRRFLKRVLFPAFLIVLGLATAGVTFKVYVLDKRNASKKFADVSLWDSSLLDKRLDDGKLSAYSYDWAAESITDTHDVIARYAARTLSERREPRRPTTPIAAPSPPRRRTVSTNEYASITRPPRRTAGTSTISRSAPVPAVTSTVNPSTTTVSPSAPSPALASPSSPRTFAAPVAVSSGLNDKVEHAARLYQANDFKGAEEYLREVIKEYPKHPKARNMLGEVYARQRKWNEAIENFGIAVEGDSTNAEFHNNLGLVLSQLDKDDVAENHLRRANQLDPLNTTILMNLAWHYRKLKRYEDALVYLDSASVLDPKNSGVASKRVQTLLDLAMFDKAEEIIRAKLTEAPTDPQANLMMAVLYARQGSVNGAIEWIDKAGQTLGREQLRKMLERINDFDTIKNSARYQEYLAGLSKTG